MFKHMLNKNLKVEDFIIRDDIYLDPELNYVYSISEYDEGIWIAAASEKQRYLIKIEFGKHITYHKYNLNINVDSPSLKCTNDRVAINDILNDRIYQFIIHDQELKHKIIYLKVSILVGYDSHDYLYVIYNSVLYRILDDDITEIYHFKGNISSAKLYKNKLYITGIDNNNSYLDIYDIQNWESTRVIHHTFVNFLYIIDVCGKYISLGTIGIEYIFDIETRKFINIKRPEQYHTHRHMILHNGQQIEYPYLYTGDKWHIIEEHDINSLVHKHAYERVITIIRIYNGIHISIYEY